VFQYTCKNRYPVKICRF